MIAASGMLNVLPSVQRIKIGVVSGPGIARTSGSTSYSVHVLIDGELDKTVPSNLTAEDLAELRMRGASPAGPPPATPAAGPGRRPARRHGHRGRPRRRRQRQRRPGRAHSRSAPELARRTGHAAPRRPPGPRRRRRRPGQNPARPIPAATAASSAAPGSPPPAARPSTRPDQRPAQGPPRRRHHGHPPMATHRRSYAGKNVTIYVEDTHFRVTCDGARTPCTPEPNNAPSPGGKPRSTPRNLKPCPASPETVNHVLSQTVKQVLRPHTTTRVIASTSRTVIAAGSSRRRSSAQPKSSTSSSISPSGRYASKTPRVT